MKTQQVTFKQFLKHLKKLEEDENKKLWKGIAEYENANDNG